METIKKNYKLFIAIMIGTAIGSILTHPADKKLLHSHSENNMTDIATIIGKSDSTINRNSRKIAVNNKNKPAGNNALLSHKNSSAKKSQADEHENYRSVTTSPSKTKRTTNKNVRLAGALD